ncbi:MAG: hypothetical protein L7U62_01855 [Candidatus Poseidoniaceae archaeon]|nr:hypothetical protein [Candidatus Poseidoniaceae archaeon]
MNESVKRMTEYQSSSSGSANSAASTTLIESLKTVEFQCAASFESQNITPIMWAGCLERENSGFSV